MATLFIADKIYSKTKQRTLRCVAKIFDASAAWHLGDLQ